MDGGIFIYQIQFHGVSFSDNALVIQKKTLKWEPSTEKLYVWDSVLKEEVNMAHFFGEGGHQQRFFFTS